MFTFYAMNKKGFFVIKNIIEKYNPEIIEAVISSIDKNVKKDYYDDIKKLCKSYKVPFFDRNDKGFVVQSKFIFAIGWRWLIQNEESKVIIFHDSLLPKYRGFAPLVSCLINGEKKIGVTALYASEHYDAGQIIKQKEVEISFPITISEAITKVQSIYLELVVDIIDQLLTGIIPKGYDQDSTKASYSLWRDELDYHIDWRQDSEAIRRFVDAVGFPFKGAYSFINNKRIRITRVELVEDVIVENRNNMVGKVIFQHNDNPIVVCGKGLIKIIEAFEDEVNTNALPFQNFRTRLS
ncbi:methionyl-tRNA formyltransferase [Brevibacillus sp. Leaf182]|uniref:methionyl-tRNA formyltransferase n=1 Tax=Brevibacillus sp. Leaf182 TaxID=1736290 RepID=UPI0006FE3F5C|nr:formyltransferase family protein [Brevibacillus sp. Leaf182]RAT98711.1 methionyl-tRNA formyltransferase [Brevibacillus sp. Leaf182]